MPLDSTGAPAPRSLSRFIDRRLAERRARLKKLKARASKVGKPRRQFDAGRLACAEYVLGRLMLRADYLGHGVVAYGNLFPMPETTHFLLIAVTDDDFGRLCELGSELEEQEENGDHEPDHCDEPALGSADGQPNQTGWANGAGDDDREDDEEREDDEGLI